MPNRANLIYLDNAATSWPKSPSVSRAMADALSIAGSAGRSAHSGALDASRAVFKARKNVASLLNVDKIENILFQPSCTQAANLVLKGFLHPGDAVLVSSSEHNSVTRPLYELSLQGVRVDWIPLDACGIVDLYAAEALMEHGAYKALICLHGSNVSGAIQPIKDLTTLAHSYGAAMIVDGAQAGGHLDVDLQDLSVDAWFCSGHKGLGGPQGIGILYLTPDITIPPLINGGTGSGDSDRPAEPFGRPDAYEAGTAALPVICGLGAALEDLQRERDDRRNNEMARTVQLHEGLAAIPTVTVLGPPLGQARLPIVSIISAAISPDQLAAHLDMRYSIAIRAGIHCAPKAHEALGTRESGAARFSPGAQTTAEEIDRTVAAVEEIISDAQRFGGIAP